uniref:Uncharacterized protein n=1 Tax=Sphaerodactylus townsendi TaxID=933632 RepID=A0ACB8FPI6_9SAUR
MEGLIGLSTFKIVQIKTRFGVPLICVRDAWLERKGPILLRYLQILAKEHYMGECRKASSLISFSFYFFAASIASTSSSCCKVCHCAMGRLGLANMSDQCRSSAPVLL